MNTGIEKKKRRVDMSALEIKARLGLAVSPRQLRRYVKEGLIPASWVEKNANGHFRFKVPEKTRWAYYREKIEDWRDSRFKRGWQKRPRRVAGLNPKDKSTAIVTIEGINRRFQLWVRKMFPEIVGWESDKLDQLHNLLFEAGTVFLWVEKRSASSATLAKKREVMMGLLDKAAKI